ncbi:MAG: Mitochondrial presequence protease [Lichina confinis]|nr:MAG: Mitochondrial presequence protease [Lichina confinis]
MGILCALWRSACLESRGRPSLTVCRQRARLGLKPAGSRRPYATATTLDHHSSPGTQLHGFTLRRTKRVPELELTAYHLQHDKTGADYLHVARDDKNNVFSIGFKTNPPDGTGVPHILEHTTLCGSKRYPVRDPFFKMLPRSLSNFMNAFTSSDHTSYPFATTNQQDFSNLLSVYLDATLNPLLRANDFAQEGWRIGPANPTLEGKDYARSDEDSRLVFKGVVYNEMKGQMSDASYLFHIQFQKHLFPSLNNSGGDPQKMTDLTYDQLVNFHHQHYHPSNAKIFTYGDMPLPKHLQEIDTRLEHFDRIAKDDDIKLPITLADGPHEVTVEGPVDPLVDPFMQHKTSISWLTSDTSDIQETFALGVVSTLLLDGYGSPFYRNLIEAGLGQEWSPNTGLDTSGKVGVFSVGLMGVKEENVKRVKEVIRTTTKAINQDGFEKSKVDGILHQLELALKHKVAHFGMGVMQRLQPGWFNGVDPFDALAWNQTISSFKERFLQDRYLEGLLEKYFLNDNTLTFTMTPSQTYAEKLSNEESSRLSEKIQAVVKRAGGEEAARKELEQKEQELLEVQARASDEPLDCLPTLQVSDIPRRKDANQIRDADFDRVKVQWREAATNGLTYFRAVNVIDLPVDLRMYIPIFTDAIMRLGTRTMTTEQIEDLIKLKTGGVGASYYASTSPNDSHICSEGFAFSGYALDHNVPQMYKILRMLVLETDFDSPQAKGRIQELLQAAANGALDGVAESGHSYARRFAEAGLTAQGRYSEQTGGLTQVKLIARLAAGATSGQLHGVIEKLKAIQSIALTSQQGLRVAITCSPDSAHRNEAELRKFLETLPFPQPSRRAQASQPAEHARKTLFNLPYQVHYTGLAIPTVGYTDPAGAPLQILAQLLTHKHLHHEIREKGGAYGGGAYSRGLSGTFGFYSYRDPNPRNTLKVLQSAGQWARDREWPSRDIEEAKLSVFQSVDAPQSVNEEGMLRFLSGISDDMRQRRREQLLDVTAEDVQRAANDYVTNPVERGYLAVLGPKQGWLKEADGWNISELGTEALTADA